MTHPFETEMKILAQTIGSVARKVDYTDPQSVKAGSEVVNALTAARKKLERMCMPAQAEPTHLALLCETVVGRMRAERGGQCGDH